MYSTSYIFADLTESRHSEPVGAHVIDASNIPLNENSPKVCVFRTQD